MVLLTPLMTLSQDIVDVAPDRLPNYEEKLKIFYEEHIHADEEIRFALEGSGMWAQNDPPHSMVCL